MVEAVGCMGTKCPLKISSTCFSEQEAVDSMPVLSAVKNVLIAGQFGAQFGGPGIRIHTFGGRRPRRPQAQNGQPPGNTSVFYQLLPVLVLLAFTIIPAIFNGFTPPAPPPPSFVFEAPKPPFTLQRLTPQHSIPYFVNPSDVSSLSISKLRQLDQKAEIIFVRGLRDQCQIEYDMRQQKLADAQGWWGQIVDQKAWEAARTMRLGSCDKLRG